MMINKKLILLTLLGCSSFLTACSVSMNTGSKFIKQVTAEQLPNGTVTKIGYVKPDISWRCRQLDRKAEKWTEIKFKSIMKIGGPYQTLQEQAISYANSKQLKPNYIYLETPQETSIEGFNLHPSAEAVINYYQCKTTPPLKTSLF